MVVFLPLTEKHPAAMQGERNSAGVADAKLHVTCIILLFVFAFTATWSGQERKHESKTKTKKQRTTNSASLAVLSLPAASSHHRLNTPALSPASLRSLPCQGDTTTTSNQGQQEAFDILWKLLKIDGLHRAQKVSPAKGDEAEPLSSSASQVRDLLRSVCFEEMLDTEGHTSTPSLKRWGSPELTLDEALENLCVPGEEAEDASSGSTRAITAAGTQRRHCPSLLPAKDLLRVDRGLFAASCR